MNITTKNYFAIVKSIGVEKLPPVLKQAHAAISEKTEAGTDWSHYQKDEDFKRVVNLAFRKLEEYKASQNLSGRSQNEKSEEKRKPKVNPYSNIAKECQFIERFLAFHNQILYKNTFGIFIDDLQKAIQDKKIRKTSPVAKDIIAIQNAVIKQFNTMQNAAHFVLRPETIKRLKGIVVKWQNSYEDIDQEYVKSKKKSVGLEGVPQNQSVNVMPSTQFTTLQFDTIGLKDKWKDFIGDPAPGFTAMVFGMPKMGKSYLCVDFAGYLARNHGKVLYVAKEEKLDKTLQDKLKEKNVSHENLTVADGIPANLSEYDFIFLDSVNKLGLTSKDLEKLKMENKGKSFIYIFQATKSGKFKGNNEFQHDVDVVIEVPERGKAVQFGRYNQGGSMDIFASEGLSGVKSDTIEIETELPLALEEIFHYIKKDGEKVEDIVSILDTQPQRAISEVKEILKEMFEEKKLNISYKDIEHAYNDSDNIVHGVAYFSLKLSGTKSDLKKVAGDDKHILYDWDGTMEGSKNKGDSLDVSEKVSNLDGMKKKNANTDWTEPEHLSKTDHAVLKEINRLYKAKKYKEAMNRAMETDTIVREEIPGDIWKKMGGQLTKTGEEKLRERNCNPPRKIDLQKKKKPTLVFNGTIRLLKGVIEREWDLELTDADYIEILNIAQERSDNFLELTNEIDPNLTTFLTQMAEALNVWDKKEGKTKEKFDPRFYANRKDDDNPSFIFSLTSNQLLSEAIKGDFDLVYLVRRELANRGLDSNGRWVGFNEAKKIHRI